MPEEIEEQSFDMDGAVDSLGEDLFGKSEEVEESDELELESEETEEIEEPDKDAEVEKKAAPQSWKKEMHSFYEGLDPVVQSYILEREEQMREGLDKDRNDANLGRTMRDITSPYDQMLKERGIEAPQAVKALLNAHYQLTTAPQQQKIQLLNQLAQSYGVGQQPTSENPEISAMMQKFQQLESEINMGKQQAQQRQQAQIESEVSTFADAQPYFDDVSEEIAKFISAGYDLEEAYEKAVWANPVTRQKEIDRLNEEKSQETGNKVKKEAEAAKKAKSVNVRGRNTRKAPTAPLGTMEDTMKETLREINSRSA